MSDEPAKQVARGSPSAGFLRLQISSSRRPKC